MVNMAEIESSSTGFAPINNSPVVASPTHVKVEAEPSTGVKRKRDPKGGPKFYAVRVGQTPGIYHTWADCLGQVRGFPKASFKSFTSLTEAQQFLTGGQTAGDGSGKKWYGVRSGRVPGVYSSWPEVLEQITGWKLPKHRGFKTRIEAELYVKDGQVQQNGEHANGDTAEPPMESIEGADGMPAAKKTKLNGKAGVKKNGAGAIKGEAASPDPLASGGEYEPGEAPMPADAEDGFDPSIILDKNTGQLRYKTGEELTRTKYQATRPAPEAAIRIYTDGSSLSNGQISAIGGVGVYFGPGDRRNISEGLAGTKQTNQRAELTAILRALEVAPKDRKVIIISDSNYAIKCTNEWFRNWRRNGWLNASKKPVENKDLIQKVIDNLEQRYEMNRHRQQGYGDEDDSVEPDDGHTKPGPWERGPAGVKFVWVKGHDKSEGNNAADELATAGAREAREMVAGFGDDEYS